MYSRSGLHTKSASDEWPATKENTRARPPTPPSHFKNLISARAFWMHRLRASVFVATVFIHSMKDSLLISEPSENLCKSRMWAISLAKPMVGPYLLLRSTKVSSFPAHPFMSCFASRLVFSRWPSLASAGSPHWWPGSLSNQRSPPSWKARSSTSSP